MSIALGNQKPEQLLEVEKIVWRALITLSLGTTPPEDVLGDLVLNIPWNKLQPPFLTASHQDSEWFITQATPVSAINDMGTATENGDTSHRQLPLAIASSVPPPPGH
jgi:hypothetical protein